MALCLSVHLSVTSRYCIEMSEQIELIFGVDATLGSYYIVLATVAGRQFMKPLCTTRRVAPICLRQLKLVKILSL